MKVANGLIEEQEFSDGSDHETEQIFKSLRPNANYKLNDILTGSVIEKKPKLFKK